MPKLQNQTPKMCRDRDQAYTRINGKRIQLGKWGSHEAKEAYDRLIAEWLSNGRRMPQPAPDDEEESATVTEIAVEFADYARGRYKPGKVSSVESVLKLLRSLYGREPAHSFGPKRLRIVRDQMLQKGWSRSYINEQVRWIRTAFKWAASHELCDESIYRRLATVEPLKRGEARETEAVKPIPRHAIRRVRPHLSRQVRALIALQLLSGARAAELVHLRPADLNTKGAVWTYTPDDHKTAHQGKQRVIYFGPRAQRVLQLFMSASRRVDKPIFSPRQANAAAKATGGPGRRSNQKPTPRKSSRTTGDRYTTDSYRRAIHRACKAAGVEQWGPHRLRHNAATFLRRGLAPDNEHQTGEPSLRELRPEVPPEVFESVRAELGGNEIPPAERRAIDRAIESYMDLKLAEKLGAEAQRRGDVPDSVGQEAVSAARQRYEQACRAFAELRAGRLLREL